MVFQKKLTDFVKNVLKIRFIDTKYKIYYQYRYIVEQDFLVHNTHTLKFRIIPFFNFPFPYYLVF